MKLKICIPSKWRAWRITSIDLFPKEYHKDIFIYVEENEYEEYEKEYWDSFNVVNIWTNNKWISLTRNFIIEDSKNRYCLTIDDDITTLRYKKKKTKSIRRLINEMIHQIDKWFILVWIDLPAFNNFVTEKRTINWYPTWAVMINTKLLNRFWINYDRRFKLMEDIDLFLQVRLNNLETIKLNDFVLVDYSYKERTRKYNSNLSWCWDSWNWLWRTKKIVDLFIRKYWEEFIKPRQNKLWYWTLTVYKKRLEKYIKERS